jgi:hypothetical protein
MRTIIESFGVYVHGLFAWKTDTITRQEIPNFYPYM